MAVLSELVFSLLLYLMSCRFYPAVAATDLVVGSRICKPTDNKWDGSDMLTLLMLVIAAAFVVVVVLLVALP